MDTKIEKNEIGLKDVVRYKQDHAIVTWMQETEAGIIFTTGKNKGVNLIVDKSELKRLHKAGGDLHLLNSAELEARLKDTVGKKKARAKSTKPKGARVLKKEESTFNAENEIEL